MFTDESRFALEPDDKRIRMWRIRTRNQPQNITHSEAEALWCTGMTHPFRGLDSIDEMSSFCSAHTTLNGVIDAQLSKGGSVQDGGQIGHLCKGF
ncbi:hypothetical protein TNCV_2040061 [Trichonephila clavipes]|nr:hypothetical protein TNCV_2040061 [Trichonephila clavipes]